MTYESYIEQVMSNNPEFVVQMNERVAREYSSLIAATKAEFDSRMEEVRAAWIKNRGEDVYNQNADTIRRHIEFTIPRLCYIKNIELDGDKFDVEIDLLKGTWDLL